MVLLPHLFQWTPKDGVATLKIHAKCDDVMQLLLEELCLEIPHYDRYFHLILSHLQAFLHFFLRPSFFWVFTRMHYLLHPIHLLTQLQVCTSQTFPFIPSNSLYQQSIPFGSGIRLSFQIPFTSTSKLSPILVLVHNLQWSLGAVRPFPKFPFVSVISLDHFLQNSLSSLHQSMIESHEVWSYVFFSIRIIHWIILVNKSKLFHLSSNILKIHPFISSQGARNYFCCVFSFAHQTNPHPGTTPYFPHFFPFWRAFRSCLMNLPTSNIPTKSLTTQLSWLLC